ncbi:MAG: ParA family protein [Nitrospirae bacterium]|nr:ParA family protein [Nitrospirota bacterium]MCL5285263.1 ParA family protein [Nitrospirota bacterium]
MARIVAIANQKGGVGKTTTTINLAASLAVEEKKVLVIDLDPQSNTSSGMGITAGSPSRSSYELLAGKHPLRDLIQKTALPYLSAIPCSVAMAGFEPEVAAGDPAMRHRILKDSLPQEDLSSFEYVLLDCPPSLGFITLNALVASHSVLIPVQCEYFALEGLGQLMKTMDRVRQRWNMDLAIEGILPTMFDRRNRLSASVLEELKKHFPKDVFSSIIPRNVTLGEAPSHGMPAVLYDVMSKGAQSYMSLAKEILAYG